MTHPTPPSGSQVRTGAPPHTIVIGGGIAGLTAAWRLDQALERDGLPGTITLLEKAPRFGGRIWTIQAPPFTCENGPEGFVANRPEALALCRDLGMTDADLIWMNYEGPVSAVYRRGGLTVLPHGVAHAILTDPDEWVAAGLISQETAARIRQEAEIPPRTDGQEETIREFFSRRFGDAAFDDLYGPLLRGMALEADVLSVRSTMPELPALEAKAGSITGGLRASQARAEAAGKVFDTRTPLVSPRAGMQAITDGLVARLQASPRVTLRAQAPVRAIRQAGPGQWQVDLEDGTTLDAATVILAAPAPAVATLLAPLDPEAPRLMGEISYRSAATVHLGFREADLAGQVIGTGYTRDHREGGLVNAVTWDSQRWLTRTPAGYHILRVFFREGATDEGAGLSDDDLVAAARADIRAVMGLDAEPIYVQVGRWEPHGLPRYPVGHMAKVAQLRERLAPFEGLVVIGGYDAAGVTDAIVDGEKAAVLATSRLQALVSA